MTKWNFNRPTEEGNYYCLLIREEWYDGKPTGRTVAWCEARHFGRCHSWKMDGEPDTGLVWEEQTGSYQGEKVHAWTELPPLPECDLDLPAGVVWE